jgi:DNA adenine methylase
VIISCVILAREHEADRRHAYAAVRERFNQRLHAGAARAAEFIYLNKTGFNGLFRVNKRGLFNVPLGKTAKGEPNAFTFDAALLRDACAALQGVRLRSHDFTWVLEEARTGDFVHLDPPYFGTYAGYSASGFDEARHAQLASVVRELDARGCRVMLHNSDHPDVRSLYAGFDLTSVSRSGTMNSDTKRRGQVGELIIRNYAAETTEVAA